MMRNLYKSIAAEAEAWAEQAMGDNGCGIPDGATENTDSPIEAQLLAAYVFLCRVWGEDVVVALKGTIFEDEWYESSGSAHATIVIPQFKIGDYRVDFALFTRSAKSVRLVIECDGHQFHERTKEQAQRDKSRDRHLQGLSYKVLRFTGSEIYRAPIEAAREVQESLQGAIHDAWLGAMQ